MKRKIRTPYFEIGTKNYIYGDTVLEYAKAADAAHHVLDVGGVAADDLLLVVFNVGEDEILEIFHLCVAVDARVGADSKRDVAADDRALEVGDLHKVSPFRVLYLCLIG